MDGSIITVIIAVMFMVIWLFLETQDQKKLSIFLYVLKDIAFLLFILFIFFSLSTSTILYKSTANSYTYLNGTINTTTYNYYEPTPALSGLVRGYGLALYAFIILWFMKFVFDIYDHFTNQ